MNIPTIPTIGTHHVETAAMRDHNTSQPAHPRSKLHMIYTIAIIGFIYTLHMVVPMYSNSSFLSVFADEKTVGYIYMAGSALTILSYLVAPTFIRKLGNYTTSLWLVFIQIFIFYGLIAADSSAAIAFLFIAQSAVISLIGLSLDIYLEKYTNQANAGTIRGMYTATLNASWVIAPLIGSLIINGTNNYRNTYMVSFAMLFPLLYLIYRNFPRFKDPAYKHPSPWQLVRHISRNHNWVKLFTANTILQIFYAWMTVYTPIYLNKTVGLSWESIGIILVIMLVPFPLTQYPLGKLADKKYGEKEMMFIGFLIMGLTTISLAYIKTPTVILWAVALFATRIGAAAAEIMMETYFFKTVSPSDTATLGAFRITRPIAYFIAPLITIIGLLFTSHEYLFIILGIISLLAIIPVSLIKDTN